MYTQGLDQKDSKRDDADSPERLLQCLELDSRISRKLERLFSYAHMKSDEDTRVSKYQGMQQTLQQELQQLQQQHKNPTAK